MPGLKLAIFFLGISYVFANGFQEELIADIKKTFAYFPVAVTFSINIPDIPAGQIGYPNAYTQGYNELDLLGDNNRVIKKVPFYLDLKVFLPTLSKQKEKGELLEENDFVHEWKNMKEYTSQVIVNKSDCVGKELKFYKKKSDVLYRFDVKEPDAIKKQDKCLIQAKVGNVMVTMPGVALKNGSIGSTIKVLNEKTGKMLDVRVINSKNVEVLIN